MDDVIMRNMTEADIPGVLAIEKLSFATPWSYEAFKNEITKNCCARYIVAAIGNIIAGYGGMWLVVDEGHITNIAVHPEFRGVGIGNMIMEAMINTAHNEGLTALTLEVRKTNTTAQNLYKKYGFVSAGIRPHYYGDNNEDAVIMWKRDV